MKILLTGSTGFIGKHLSRHLKKKHEVLTPNHAELDLADDNSVDRFLKNNPVNIIIHCAGKPGHRNVSDPSGVFYTNTRMYFNFVRNSEFFDRLIIIGSGGVYGMNYYEPKMSEDFFGKHMPEDEHGFFRYVTGSHIEKSDKIIDLRLFGVFGPYEDYAIRFISNAICKTIFDLPITIKQNRKFDYIYIDDVLPIIDFFLNADNHYKAYNVTPDKSVELYEIAKVIKKVSGKNVPIIVKKTGMGVEYSGSNQRLRKEIHDLSFTDLTDSIKQLYNWYADHKEIIEIKYLLTDK